MCLSPIWIKNKHYFNSKLESVLSRSNATWDAHLFVLSVPCGKCEECRRQQRADWYIRLLKELEYQKKTGGQSMAITITVSPRWLREAMKNLPKFVRRINEHIRYKHGQSIKHAFFPEFGEKTHRLHLHGFLFGDLGTFNYIRRLFAPFGYVWLTNGTSRYARYSVKYITKCSSDKFCDRRSPYYIEGYTRKYVSRFVGLYLGTSPAPSYSVNSWTFFDRRKGLSYHYRIPRYYKRFENPWDTEKKKRALALSMCLYRTGAVDPVFFHSDFTSYFTKETFASVRERCQSVAERLRVRLIYLNRTTVPYYVLDYPPIITPNYEFSPLHLPRGERVLPV